METFELRYFAAVARHESVSQAARDLAVSAGALSKAVARLEDELSVKLFDHVGRNIRLTAHGRLLAQRAAEILRLEESARLELRGSEAGFQVRLAGPEVLLLKVAPELMERVQRGAANASFELEMATEAETVRRVAHGDAHLGLISGAPPAGLAAKVLFKTTFQTCVGKGHPLYKAAQAGKTLTVERVLEHAFVSPDRPVLGTTGAAQAPDGWRDDMFPRRLAYVTASLPLIAELVTAGKAVAYLPDYYVARIGAAPLMITGCPYTCKQTVSLLAREPERLGWLARLF